MKLVANSKVLVSIIDASHAGGSSRTVASTELAFEPDSAISKLDFELRLDDEFDDSADLLLTVHVDHDGDGSISKGDQISMLAYPINFESEFYQIEVKRV